MKPESIVEEETVHLDGQDVLACEFRDCTLIYCGGEPPSLRHCTFIDCEWTFDGPAGRTLQFLATLRGSAFGEVVEETFDNIREGEYG